LDMGDAWLEKLLVLIVTYNGVDTVADVLESCYQPGIEILVIDNASIDGTRELILKQRLPKLELISSPHNIGVAAAYNLGLKQARKRGKSWILILDQDSLITGSAIHQLYDTAQELSRKGNPVGAIFPTIRSAHFPTVIHLPYYWTGKRLLQVTASAVMEGPIPVDSSITSGTLYRVEALMATGGFCEPYFIDFVDHECHIRMRQAGWSLWWEPRAELLHRLGEIQKMTAVGLWIEHSPYRYYYMARNMTRGYRKLGGMKALFYFWLEMLRHMKRLYCYGRQPGSCYGYILKGVLDGLRGIDGPLDPAV